VAKRRVAEQDPSTSLRMTGYRLLFFAGFASRQLLLRYSTYGRPTLICERNSFYRYVRSWPITACEQPAF